MIKRVQSVLRGFLQLNRIQHLNMRLSSVRVLLIFEFLILFHQTWQIRNSDQITNEFKRHDATGFNHDDAQRFFPFYYYTGQYPLTVYRTKFDYSKDSIQHIIDKKGSSLVNEYAHFSRFGDYTRIWFYLPNAWMTGNADKPSIIPANRIVFIVSLMLIVFLCWKVNKTLQGFLLALLLSSSPFLAYEIHINENLFGTITILPVLCACIYYYLFQRNFKWTLLIGVGCLAITIAVMANARGEILPIVVSCTLAPLFFREWRWLHRLAVFALFPVVFFIANKSIKLFFHAKIEAAKVFVKEHGGVAFEGGTTTEHPFWHPVYCGLGDFDTEKGYVWQDTVAYAYALPILRKQTGKPLKYPGVNKWAMAEYYDSTHRYYKKPETIEGYEKIIKQKVLDDIKNDPGWYMTILGKRFNYIFGHTSPQELNLIVCVIHLPYWGYLFFPVLLLLVFAHVKEWLPVLFTLPMCASGLIVVSMNNNSFINGFHFFTCMILLTWIIEILIDAAVRIRTKLTR